ncbi:MAG: hypothetical protein J6U54_08680 [Clostridiales bacterium]|nr:hypothetical protein [Clostridiales bacterium]
MIGQIIESIVKHKAAIALGGAMIGVGITAVMASRDAKSLDEALEIAEYDKDQELTDTQVIEMFKEQGISEEEIQEFKDYDVIPEEFEYLTKKEKAIIFAKNYWRTGLVMAVTFALMIFSHVSMAKEIAVATAALGALSTKYKDLKSYLKEKYPEQYEEIMRRLNRENARKKISETGFKKEESYDGRKRYYFPLSDQIVFMKPEDMVKVQGYMSRTIGTEMELYLNDILDYIHIELGYKDVHISDVDYKWSFPEDSVGDVDFPQIMFEYDDVLDEDKSYVVCQVVTTSYDPEVIINKSA